MNIKCLIGTVLLTLTVNVSASTNFESRVPISVKTVYPTGDKPMIVVTFKCPTEVAFNVAPPPVKIIHYLVPSIFDGVNYTGLLPVNLQNVCQ